MQHIATSMSLTRYLWEWDGHSRYVDCVFDGWDVDDGFVPYANFDPLRLCSLSARFFPPWRR